MSLEHAEGSSRGPAAPVLDQVLPLLLPADDHLTAKDRLACFGVSKGASGAVLRHTPCTKLQLTLGGAAAAPAPAAAAAAAATAGGGGGGSTSTSRVGCAPGEAAQQLAAQSSNVALSMHGGLTTPAACLWQSITSMHLQGVQLAPADLSSHSQLQLHKLPRLHTLSLEACHMNQGSTPWAASAPQQAAATQQLSSSNVAAGVRTFKCVGCTPSSATILQQALLDPAHLQTLITNGFTGAWPPEPPSFLRMALSLLDPGQLQTLITDDSATAADLLAQLPALQEVQLLSVRPAAGQPQPPGGQRPPTLGDYELTSLLSHPHLTRMSLPRLDPFQDYSDRPCRWTSLHLTQGSTVKDLAALPLARIESCTVTGRLVDAHPGPVDEAVQCFNSCGRLVFQPEPNPSCTWSPAGEGTFTLTMWCCSEAQAGQLIQVVIRNWPGGALVLDLPHGGFLPPLAASSLAGAPPTLTTISLFVNPLPPQWADMEEDPQEGVLPMHLPAHITRVVLHASSLPMPLERWIKGVTWYVKGVTRSLRVTLYHHKADYQWPEGIEQVVREWLDTHASNQVQVDFQRRQ